MTQTLETVIANWLDDPLTESGEKRAFFDAFEAAGKQFDEECLDILTESLNGQIEEGERRIAEAEENVELIENVVARQQQLTPGSLTAQIIIQAEKDMDRVVEEYKKDLRAIQIS